MPFNYEQPDPTTYQQEYERQKEAEANGGNDLPMLYLKKGVTQIRVLPPWPGSNKRWMRKMEEHVMNIGGRWVTATCPRAPEYNRPCPICEKGESLHAEGISTQNEDLVKKAANYAPRINYLANVICYSSPDPEKAGLDKGVMIMKFGTKVKQQLLGLNQDAAGGWAGITDVTNGVDLRVTRSGEKQATVYTVQPLPNRSNLVQVLASQGYDLNKMSLFDLDKVYEARPYDDLVGVMEGRQRTPGFRPSPVAQPVLPMQPQGVPSQSESTPRESPQPVQPSPVSSPVQPEVAPQPVAAPVGPPNVPVPEGVQPPPVAPPVQPQAPFPVTPPPMPPPPPSVNNETASSS